MKKKILIGSGILFCLISSAFSADLGKVNLGVRIAPAITWLDIKNTGEIESDGAKFRFNGALNVYYNFTENYAIVTGLGFNTFGGKFEGFVENREQPELSYRENISYNFHEIELPVSLKLRTKDYSNFRYMAQVGVGMGIVVGGNATRDDVYKRKNFDYHIMPVRALYNVGIGVEYDLNGTILTGGINYKGWISNLFFYNKGKTYNLDLQKPNTEKTYSEKVIFRPSAIEIVMGVMF